MKNWYYRYNSEYEAFKKVEEEFEPTNSGRDVVVKPLLSGVCGSDLSQVFHHKERATVGHEWIGEVLSHGKEVSGFKPGDLVTSVANIRCGKCHFCLKGNPELCKRRELLGSGKNSILSNEISLDHSDLIKIPKGLSLKDAVLLEVSYIGDCTFHASQRLGVENNPRILIFGAGPIGIFSALSFKHRGVENITIVETSAWRLQKAKEIGFKASPFAEIILDHNEINQYDLVIDCTGDHHGPGALKVLPLFAKEFGAVVIVGKYLATTLQEKPFIGKGLKLTWVGNHKRSSFLHSIDFWKDKIHLYSEILTNSYEIENINKAYEDAIKKEVLKCLLTYK